MPKQAKVAVILSGCGVFDGAEIHESVITLLALARSGAKVICAAPDITQRHVINHATGEIDDEDDRNVLEEAARISRGDIRRLDQIKMNELDAIIFVGGFGVAKNFSSLAFDGQGYDIDPVINSMIQDAHDLKIALGFMCIAPALAAAALGRQKVRLTIGNDAETAAILEHKGAQHINCPVDEIVIDKANRVVTTPAYMLAENILQAEAGINKLVAALLSPKSFQ
jgi:enhancing lycopene biosynthesis protein 2